MRWIYGNSGPDSLTCMELHRSDKKTLQSGDLNS